jgi:NAD+ diphosphatase
MIQDIFPKSYHNEYGEKYPGPRSFIIQFKQQKVLAKYEDNRIEYPVFTLFGDRCSFIYLFAIDEREYYLARTDEDIEINGFTYVDISVFRTAHPKHRAFAGITAYQLYSWYLDNQYCGRCGSKLEPDHKERMLRCSTCHNMVYPKIAPAVIVGVINGDYLLLTKYAGRAYNNYALIAGFTEIGESAEKTVEREVMEEVGLKVKNIRYYKSQPWSFSGTLLMGFFADLDGDSTITLDEEELAEGQWFKRDEIIIDDNEISLTREMMYQFVKNKV